MTTLLKEVLEGKHPELKGCAKHMCFWNVKTLSDGCADCKEERPEVFPKEFTENFLLELQKYLAEKLKGGQPTYHQEGVVTGLHFIINRGREIIRTPNEDDWSYAVWLDGVAESFKEIEHIRWKLKYDDKEKKKSN